MLGAFARIAQVILNEMPQHQGMPGGNYFEATLNCDDWALRVNIARRFESKLRYGPSYIILSRLQSYSRLMLHDHVASASLISLLAAPIADGACRGDTVVAIRAVRHRGSSSQDCLWRSVIEISYIRSGTELAGGLYRVIFETCSFQQEKG